MMVSERTSSANPGNTAQYGGTSGDAFFDTLFDDEYAAEDGSGIFHTSLQTGDLQRQDIEANDTRK